jgi:alkylhydroperoxidase/carboxymuconolactone decarboxylase family protein YurZ
LRVVRLLFERQSRIIVRRETGKDMDTVQILQGSTNLKEKPAPENKTEVRLQDLLPIAMVIVGGCETCAEKMVERALREGSSFPDIDKILRIIAGMQKFDCFANAVGPGVVSRMDKPLEAGRKALEKAMHSSPIVS